MEGGERWYLGSVATRGRDLLVVCNGLAAARVVVLHPQDSGLGGEAEGGWRSWLAGFEARVGAAA